MKKVVVVYPYTHEVLNVDVTLVSGSTRMSYVGEKTFEGKELEVVNTDAGILIIKENYGGAMGKVYAVFKHWIYWENIK